MKRKNFSLTKAEIKKKIKTAQKSIKLLEAEIEAHEINLETFFPSKLKRDPDFLCTHSHCTSCQKYRKEHGLKMIPTR